MTLDADLWCDTHTNCRAYADEMTDGPRYVRQRTEAAEWFT